MHERGTPDESLIDHKDPERAMALEKSPEWEALNVNHLEGRSPGFFCYTDLGADEIGEDGRLKILRHKEYFDPAAQPLWPEQDWRGAYRDLVWQCRWSGIEVPDALWAGARTGLGVPCGDNQVEDMVREDEIMREFDAWTDRFAAFVGAKGKVEPGRWRAFGYDAPGHRWADAKLKWRAIRIGLGLPPAGSSPAEQQRLGLTDDRTLRTTRSEGEKLRE